MNDMIDAVGVVDWDRGDLRLYAFYSDEPLHFENSRPESAMLQRWPLQVAYNTTGTCIHAGYMRRIGNKHK